MKRAQILSDALSGEPKKRNVVYATYQKLKTDMDRECLTVTWLDCDTKLRGKKNKTQSQSFDAVYVLSSRQESLLEKTSVNDGFMVRVSTHQQHSQPCTSRSAYLCNASYFLYCFYWSKYRIHGLISATG